MRVLVACPDCSRQFDASGRSVGGAFRCLCGRALTVPEPRGHDAAVVRCSACGGPRERGAAACGYCGADFTLHERDLHTICPACMARISDRARFCHHCATPLVPQPLGPPTRRPCPACGDGVALTSRTLDGEALPVLECARCAGLWLGRQAFDLVLERARREAPPEPDGPAPTRTTAQAQSGALYRPCPECGTLMHRVNFGRRSGVIVDSCNADGLWFDASELEDLLRWVRRGGEAAAARHRGEESAQLDRQRRLLRDSRSEIAPIEAGGGPPWLIRALADLVGRFLG